MVRLDPQDPIGPMAGADPYDLCFKIHHLEKQPRSCNDLQLLFFGPHQILIIYSQESNKSYLK